MENVILPYRTDWREMLGVIDYAKGSGADRAALDARFGAGEAMRETLNALQQLDLIERNESGDVRLTELGNRVGYAPDAQSRQQALVEALVRYHPYRIPLERARADDVEQLEAPWVEHVWQVDMRLGQPRNRVAEARTFFFRLADEAGLGVYHRGVRGQTTRLELSAGFADAFDQALATLQHDSETVPDEGRGEPERDAAAPATASAIPAVELNHTPAGSGPVTFSIQVDMSDWEIEKIETFLKLIGYLPE